ncbi:PAS domain S-box protein [Halobium palmae]|uniref:histidine kinase n=1 Tax=Halobium palmae TaxID=1776492 RepID=A0ABD5RY21_9EURY
MKTDDADALHSHYRERVYRAFADQGIDVETRIERALRAGIERLGVDGGALTRVEDGVQHLVRAVGSIDHLRAGDSCPLDRAYCRATLESDSPLSVRDAGSDDRISDAAYRTFGFGCYLGSKLVVDGEAYGTVCFVSEGGRDRPFSEAERLFVELVAGLASQALERRTYESRLRSRTDRLREEKRRLEGITETTFDVIYRIDAATEFTYVSAAAERVVGYDPVDLHGESFGDYIVPDSYPDALEAFRTVFGGDPVEGVELGFRGGDGEIVVLEVNVRPVYEDDERGEEVVEAQGVARDVTARKEREEELRVGGRAISDANLGISIADATRPGFPIVYANDAFGRLTGYRVDEITGESWTRLDGPGTDLDMASFRERIDDHESVTRELLAYRKDGTPFWTRATVTPVEDESGSITHLVGFMDDVTERKRTERLIELLNRVLRHNLRNDMNVLVGYAGMLADSSDADSDLVDVIHRTASELLKLSESARELERVARRDRTPTRVDVESVVADAVDRQRATHPDAQFDVTVSTDRGICAGAELGRALDELLGNAIEHDSDPPTRVSITSADDGDEVEVTVVDDGPGLPEMETAIVESGRETPLEHGNGLGLWLVNWVVTRYGGSFQIETSPDGHGTVATVRLPAIAPGESVETAARRPTTLFR